MSTTKDKYYWAQLRAALTAGQWSSPFPATAPNGTRLSWSELFRKFNKHCKGFLDVTEVASQTHALALLLSSKSIEDDDNDKADGAEYALDIGDECILPEERQPEAQTGYETLKKLESSNFDTLNFALAYYAYALGNPSECLAHLGKVPDVVHVQNHIPLPETLRASAMTLTLPSTTDSSISSVAASVFSDASISIPEIRDGRAWALTETFRSLCLQGMSNEKLFPNDLRKAAKSYSAAVPLLTIVESETTAAVAPTTSGKVDFAAFTRFRELWRWVERLIWRAVALASRTSNVLEGESTLWTWFGHYSTCSSYWPSNFRTGHRSAISVLYLRALIIRHGHAPPPTRISKPPLWLSVARGVVQEYRAILSVSTKFPKAGERNTKVEEFVDLCVGIWEASGVVGEYAGWVLDVLWWATRMTFNSYRILRHMTRLLHVSGDINLAKRTLRLYVQVVSKAWQAGDAGVGVDADTDQKWVETLVYGIRLLCRNASSLSGLDGIEDVREAESLIEKAHSRLDKENKVLSASLLLAEGICQSVYALKQQDPHLRGPRLVEAHALIQRSIDTHPTASAYYHLALSFARSGKQQDMQQAIVNAGLAVEHDSKDIRYWHLLGLLSAATEEWEAAQITLETAVSMEQVPGDNGLPDGAVLLNVPHTNGRAPIDGLPPTGNGHLNGSDEVSLVYLLGKDEKSIPPAADLLRPAQDQVYPSQSQRFEEALQLRMTQIALAEMVEGAEGAAEKLPEIFTWIADRKGTSSQTQTARSSLDGGRAPTMELKSPSELVLPPPVIHEIPEEPDERRYSLATPMSPSIATGSADLLPVPPMSITISPATPDEQASVEERQKGRDSKDSERDRERTLKRQPQDTPDRDASTSKKVQQMLKSQVHKSGARISTISKKIGNGVVRNGSLKRSNSTPDFHAVLRNTSYQASSIHSRTRLSSLIKPADSVVSESPPPPPSAILAPQTRLNQRTARETRLLSDVWLMSAATFRRLGKIEQAKGAIQEAEVRDESNPGVWVQLGLYHVALGHRQEALDAFQKALFIAPDNVPATVHMCGLYLSAPGSADSDSVDLAAGMLGHLTRGAGWDVPEAWYYLAKAYAAQGRHPQERESLSLALALSESRGVREIGAALGWCL
ncbi:hypothetical protein BDZ89DRAFT_1068592 [Hymenopellis radicata]|nr:hypothetical protein BDZ89DRAFT_1068592 [Hymenopellis radicata]